MAPSKSPPPSEVRLVAIHVPILERAFELAATGAFADPGEISQKLESEGYLDVQEHIRDSPLLRRQLRDAARAAREARPEPPAEVAPVPAAT